MGDEETLPEATGTIGQGCGEMRGRVLLPKSVWRLDTAMEIREGDWSFSKERETGFVCKSAILGHISIPFSFEVT